MSSKDEIRTTPIEVLAVSSTKPRTNSKENAALTSSQDFILGMQTILDQTGAYIFMKDAAGH